MKAPIDEGAWYYYPVLILTLVIEVGGFIWLIS